MSTFLVTLIVVLKKVDLFERLLRGVRAYSRLRHGGLINEINRFCTKEMNLSRR